MISELTNLFVEHYVTNNPDKFCHPCSYVWTTTTAKDVEKFLALQLLTGLIQKPSISLY